MSERMMARMMAPLARSVGNMLARGTLAMANAAAKMQTIQVRILSGEAKDSVEHFEPYGYTSNPHPGAEVLLQFFGGDRSHGVAIMVSDRRYRLAGLESGEVALYDDIGHVVRLTRAGIVIDGGGHQVTIVNTPKLRVEGGIDATGDIKDRCDMPDGRTMNAMRQTYNSHTHQGDSGGTTGTPNQGM